MVTWWMRQQSREEGQDSGQGWVEKVDMLVWFAYLPGAGFDEFESLAI
jgi:hypothetical protein